MIQRIFYIGSQDFINSPIKKTIGDYKPNYLQIIGPYFEGSKIIVIPITNQDDKTFYSLGYRTCLKQTQKSDIHMSREDKSNVALGMGFQGTRGAQPFSQTTEESIVANRNKRLPSEKSARAGNTSTSMATVRAVSKKEIEQELRESRQKRQKEDLLLSMAVRLERQLGKEPDLLDVIWYLNLNYEEIESIWDQLKIVYPNFDRRYLIKTVPEMVVAA